MSQNIYIHGKMHSSSSLDLNKYKIIDKNINYLNKSIKNITISNNSKNNSVKNVNLYNNNKNKTNIFLTKNNNNKINNNISINNSNKNKLNQNSIDQLKISPIIPKLLNTNEQNIPSLFNIYDYKDSNNININKNNNNKNKRIFDHFANSAKYEIESRRMIIEYIKVLNKSNNKKNNKNSIGININSIMAKK